MNFYTKEHRYYCGIDLHARSMYVCILNQAGEVMVHQNLPAEPDAFLKMIAPYREDVAVAVECMFTWYWLADLCQDEEIPFILGHALYMKAIHGGKAKNDKIDSRKIAGLLRSGMIPQAYVYPAEMRSTRDLLAKQIWNLEAFILQTATAHDRNAIRLLRTVHGIGKVLSLVILYEIQDIHRFPTVQDFASYSRLVKCAKESAGKRYGYSGGKIGNAHLKWAFSEAAVLFLRANPEGLKYKQRLEKKHGKSKALSILAHKLGRAVYYMLLRQKVFDMKKFLAC